MTHLLENESSRELFGAILEANMAQSQRMSDHLLVQAHLDAAVAKAAGYAQTVQDEGKTWGAALAQYKEEL